MHKPHFRIGLDTAAGDHTVTGERELFFEPGKQAGADNRAAAVHNQHLARTTQNIGGQLPDLIFCPLAENQAAGIVITEVKHTDTFNLSVLKKSCVFHYTRQNACCKEAKRLVRLKERPDWHQPDGCRIRRRLRCSKRHTAAAAATLRLSQSSSMGM